MKRILIIDTETTGLDPKVDAVIEVGAILYSVEHATALTAWSTLLPAGTNAAEAINRIPAAALSDAPDPSLCWANIASMAETAGAIVAHNAEFDRGFVPAILRTIRPWVCSKNDLEWPKQEKPGQSLVSLVLAHDLGIATAHRALADCDMLSRLFTRARELGCDLSAMMARGMRPKAQFQALVSFDEKDKAKEAGFQWEASTKRWLRTMAIEDAAALPFQTKEIR